MLVFLGDLTDRGPSSLKVIELVYQLVIVDKIAYYTPGNHCNKLYRYFLGNKVQIQHGLETTVEEYQALSNRDQKMIRQKFITLYEQADLYIQLPNVKAVVAHAGIRSNYIGRYDKKFSLLSCMVMSLVLNTLMEDLFVVTGQRITTMINGLSMDIHLF